MPPAVLRGLFQRDIIEWKHLLRRNVGVLIKSANIYVTGAGIFSLKKYRVLISAQNAWTEIVVLR